MAYQAVVAILAVVVVVLIVLIAFTCVWVLMIYRKGKEEVTLTQAPTPVKSAANPVFGDEDEDAV